MVNYAELQNKINEHFERMCDENYQINEHQNKYEYLWIYLKDDILEYCLWPDKEILEKKKSENEFAIIRLWLDDVELEDEIHYGVDADKAFRLCRENIERLLNRKDVE
ncbi:hypothetical protein FACS189450_04850 [Spirochaetia bacterium]|nr:hypothetical protein FACS189450_04850 [Spirochaetia bacterium]